MSLLQTMLDAIEREAAEKTEALLKMQGAVLEAELLRDALHQHGAEETPVFTGHGIIIYDYNQTGRMRRAIAAADLEIESEKVIDTPSLPNCRCVALTLKGIQCKVWINYDPIPLAEAA